MNTVLTKRLKRLETSSREALERRWAIAVERLKATLTPEHATLIADWLRGPDARARGADHGHGPGHVCHRCILDCHPPALVRAALLMLLDHVLMSGAPVALPPQVASVYLSDAHAYPTIACEGCGYLLPTRSRVRPDGSYRQIGTYDGACPVCARDSRDGSEDLQ